MTALIVNGNISYIHKSVRAVCVKEYTNGILSESDWGDEEGLEKTANPQTLLTVRDLLNAVIMLRARQGAARGTLEKLLEPWNHQMSTLADDRINREKWMLCGRNAGSIYTSLVLPV